MHNETSRLLFDQQGDMEVKHILALPMQIHGIRNEDMVELTSHSSYPFCIQ